MAKRELAKWDEWALAKACAIFWGFSVALLGVMHMYLGNGLVMLFATVYPWSGPTWPGILAGSLWAAVDGFIGGYIFAWLYNKLL